MTDQIVVQIDLASLVAGREETGETFGDLIVTRAAEILLKQERASAESFRKLVTVLAEDEIREAIRPAIAVALAQPLRKTNQYGDPTGEPMPLHEHITEIAREALSMKVGRDYDRKKSLLQALLAEEVERVLRRELQEELAKAKAEVLAAVREQGAQIITETIARVSRV